MGNLLALDTSSQVLSVALKTSSSHVTETKIVGFLRHAENLMPIVDKLLKEKGLTINDIDFQAKPCFGALSLDMIANNVPVSDNSLIVCMDARRDTVFSRKYRPKEKLWEATEEPQILSFQKFIASLENGALLSGNLLDRYKDEIEKQAPEKNIFFQPADYWYPKASTLISWKVANSPYLSSLKSPGDFTPIYFRLSEAEERRNHALNS